MVLQCDPGRPGMPCEDQASLEFIRDLPASVSPVLGLKVCIALPGCRFIFHFTYVYGCLSLCGCVYGSADGLQRLQGFWSWSYKQCELPDKGAKN